MRTGMWAAGIAAALFLAGCVASTPHGSADGDSLWGVRVQSHSKPAIGSCLVFTHDAGPSGASIAVVCNP